MTCTRTFAACALIAGHVFSQETTIRTTVPLVQVPVSVTDKAGHFVFGLTANDFSVSDEGKSLLVHVDDPDLVGAPLNVIVLVQVTDISESALLKIKKVGSMIGGAVVGANGLASLITYSDQITVVEPLTADEDAISKAFRNLKSVPTRNGHMVDAVAQAVEMLGSRSGARSVIVIIGESKDRGSKTRLVSILPALQNSGATVYCLEYSAFLTPLTTKASDYSPPEGGGGWILDAITETAHAMKQDTGKVLASSTGGRTLKFQTKSKLENDLIGLGAEIHSRYMLSFTPAVSTQESFHNITVQVKDRPELTVHARPGYWPKTY